MSYTILIKPSARKELFALDKNILQRVDLAILKIKDNPRIPGTVKLKEWNLYRIRVSDYKIIYTINNKNQTVEIIAVGHRRDIYRF
ncbi:MAG: type II toxin-antitoxin system RelE/ParE family toxin [Elusimicrobiota bacterium]